jgi:Xaa-Pro dipeptidase
MTSPTSSNKEAFLSSAYPATEIGFSIAEYRDRHRRIRKAMAAERIDVLFLSSPEAICYATGYQAEWYHGQCTSQWPALSGVAVHVDHDRWIHFETEDEALLTRITSVSEDVRITGDADILESIIAELRGEGWVGDGVVVGLELGSYRPNRKHSEMFEAAIRAAGADVVDGTAIVRGVRRVKSPQELSYVRTAQQLADIGMQAAIDHMAPGVTELDIYAEIVYAMAKAGGENPGIVMPVASGTKSGCVHALASRRKIMPGDIVNVDVSGVFFRYHANMARTFSIGAPHPEVANYIEKTVGALDVVAQHLKPGASCTEVVARLKDYYGPIWQDRWWVGGYELGIAFPPDWVGEFVYDEYSHEESVFVLDEVMNFEANFYLPKAAGLTMGINTLICGAEGAEFLQTTPNKLFVVD